MSVDHIETAVDGAVPGIDPTELQEWLDSLEDVIHRFGQDKVQQLLVNLQERAYLRGVMLPFVATTPYVNTIGTDDQPRYPGNLEIERKIKSYIRWNAMAMVLRANKKTTWDGDANRAMEGGVGGHISTYASSATLYEVAYNHFFHGRTADHTGDMVYFQGHASPGMYARAFLEGRLDESHLEHFRQECVRGQGLCSYPHPWLMEDFWQFPTVSMGLGPICSIYHARFLRYMQHRGILDTSKSRVYCFVGDGEVDEPETLGAITLASREKLDNLVWVVNCNLQRLDGPVRGNGKIIQELEGAFRGAGWNVIKTIWGNDWDSILAKDTEGKLVKRMGEIVDGQYQNYISADGSYIREHFFNTPELQAMVDHLSDEQLKKLRRGGHDPEKVYAAFKAATEHKGGPTVILAKTIKGYGLGSEAEGKMIAHNAKKLKDDSVRHVRDRFSIPISDDDLDEIPYYKPEEDSPEIAYLKSRRDQLGGQVPSRRPTEEKLNVPLLEDKAFARQLKGTEGNTSSTTQAFGGIMQSLMRDKSIGKRVVPIIPDEARTFGFEGMFNAVGIYSSKGQMYEPVDKIAPDGSPNLNYYRESIDGQILEEGINEAGAMGSFVAAGTAYANLGVQMIPFYTYYSMFGFQRVGDLIWLAADSRCKGFLMGATSGRTTLNGEGLQHEDGHSQLMASTVPNLIAYDPAYAYELAIIIQNGLKRMYVDNESVFYYLSIYNETYQMPAMPDGVENGILKGIYRLSSVDSGAGQKIRAQMFGSGTALPSVLRAQRILKEKYDIGTDVWSVTSYNELCRDAMAADRWNRLHPTETPKKGYIETVLAGEKGPFISSSENVRAVADQIRQWVPGDYTVLGTDGFGRSDTRQALRRHFEVDAECTAYAALVALAKQGAFDKSKLSQVLKDLNIAPDKVDPRTA